MTDSGWESRMADRAAERQAERWRAEAAERPPLTDADLHTITFIIPNWGSLPVEFDRDR